MTFSIGFSPCPNDTFIFDALVHQEIDTEGLTFEPVLEDVQTLNEWALGGKLPITKLSYGVLPLAVSRYDLLNTGSALGVGVGPLLISNQENLEKKIGACTVAIPGENTTAHLLFSLKYPAVVNKVFLRYDEIEDFVQQGRGWGVIIHENRFTYESKGLIKITDLGDYWEQETRGPIPLGGIVIKKGIPAAIKMKVDRLIRKSIEHAYAVYPRLSDYVKLHAQEMSEDIMRKHIDLYVNRYSLDLGDAGKAAVNKLFEVFATMHKRDVLTEGLFVPRP